MLCQLWRQGKKWLPFTTTKILMCWSLVVLYKTWLTFGYTNLPKQNSIPPQREIKTLLEKILENLVSSLSIVFARKAVVDETFIRTSTNIYKCFFRLMPANYTPTRCVNPCPTGLCTCGISIQKPLDSHLDKTRPVALKIWSCQRTRPDWKIESFYTTGRQKKSDRFSVDGFCSHCNIVFEATGCFYHFCPCQELRQSLTEEHIKRDSQKRELDDLRRDYIQEKVFSIIEMWECEWLRLLKTTTNVKLHIRENFPYRRSFTGHQLLEGIKKEIYLAMFNASLKYQKIWDQTLLTSFQYSRKP